MNLYILIFSIVILIYKSQFCEELKSCYDCSTSKFNCSWYNNSCIKYDLNDTNKYSNNNKIISLPFITRQYKCINDEKNIEYFEEIKNNKISILPNNKLNKNDINYHAYCFRYSLKQNVRLRINYEQHYQNSILEISIYNNITKSDLIINYINNNIINFESDFFCMKITYFSNIEKIDNLVSFYIINYTKSTKEDSINSNISVSLLFIFILLAFFGILIFICWCKSKSKEMKEIAIFQNAKRRKNKNSNKLVLPNNNKSIISQNSENIENAENNSPSECDTSNCSELQEKYFQLSKDTFVDHNCETIYSFINNLPNIDKKEIYLKAIIKTFPAFIINKRNSEFIGIFCSFCESKIKINDKICFINCGHIFHYDCIYQQIITNEEYKCIICKENITI